MQRQHSVPIALVLTLSILAVIGWVAASPVQAQESSNYAPTAPQSVGPGIISNAPTDPTLPNGAQPFTTDAAPNSLAHTGSAASQYGVLSIALTLAGLTLVVASRRRPTLDDVRWLDVVN